MYCTRIVLKLRYWAFVTMAYVTPIIYGRKIKFSCFHCTAIVCDRVVVSNHTENARADTGVLIGLSRDPRAGNSRNGSIKEVWLIYVLYACTCVWNSTTAVTLICQVNL